MERKACGIGQNWICLSGTARQSRRKHRERDTPYASAHGGNLAYAAGRYDVDAAGFLGMSEKTLRETYGHHHPAFLRGAAQAIAARPAPRMEALVISLV